MPTQASTKPDSSFIEHGQATAFVGPDAVACFRAFAIASALRLYAKSGISVNRSWTPAAMLKAASEITGKTYKRMPNRGHYALAAFGVQSWAEEMRDSIPHIERGDK